MQGMRDIEQLSPHEVRMVSACDHTFAGMAAILNGTKDGEPCVMIVLSGEDVPAGQAVTLTMPPDDARQYAKMLMSSADLAEMEKIYG